jgi:actin-like protein 6B
VVVRLYPFTTLHNSLPDHKKDEVSALVIDIGSSSLRAGYAGDDAPKAIIPTSYGYHPEPSDVDVDISTIMDIVKDPIVAEADGGGVKQPKNAKLYLGQHGPSIWRDGMEIGNPVRDGLGTHMN